MKKANLRNVKNRNINSLKRAIRLAWKNFYRESGLSFVAVLVLTTVITLFVTTFLIGGVAEILIKDVESKADITVDFQKDASEDIIFELMEEIEDNFEVSSVEYISREEAKTNFIKRFGDRPEIMEALEEVDNPLPASLNINAPDPYTYRQLANYLEDDYERHVDSVDFYHREEVIEGIFSITENARKGAFIFAGVLGFISILLVYNTIKLAIYNIGEEVRVMRLVGSSNLFIRSSFIFQGIIIGFIAATLSFLLLLLVGFLIPQSYDITIDVNLYQYFMEMLSMVLLIQFSIGIVLGVFSSLIATERYLK